MSERIKQFYEKPKTHEELVENIKKLTEIPESKDHPKVVIKLGDPEKEHKFVYMEDTEGRKYVIALPIEKFEYHRDIIKFMNKLVQRETKKRVEIERVRGGGWVKLRGERLIIGKSSGDFGEAPKEEVAGILKEAFPEIEIKAYPYRIDKEFIKKNLYDREALLDILELDGGYFEDLPTELRNDREIVLEAVKTYSYALKYTSEQLRNDRETILEVVKRNGSALEYASEQLRNDREIVLEAVKNSRSALRYASRELQKDPEILKATRR